MLSLYCPLVVIRRTSLIFQLWLRGPAGAVFGGGAAQNQHRPPQIVFIFNVNALPPSACHSRRPSPPCSPCVHENESDIVEARDTLQTAGESHKFIKVWCLLVSNEGKFSSQHQTRCRIYRNSSIVTTIARDGVRFLIDLLQIRRLMLHYTKSFN